MIKKLIIAAGFAGSMLVAVPTASANSPGICANQYGRALEACGFNLSSPCGQAATIAYQQCLESLAIIHE